MSEVWPDGRASAAPVRSSRPKSRIVPMRNGVLLALLAYAVFAFSDASIKLIEGRLDVFEISFFGALVAFGVLPFIRRPDERLTDIFRTTVPKLWALRAVSTAVSSAASVVAFTELPMPEAFSLIFLMPMFVTLLSIVFLKEEVGAWRWSAIALGFVGVLVVLRPGFRELHFGHVGALVSGLAGACAVVSFRMAGPQEKRMSLFGAGILGSLAVNGLLMLPNFALPGGETVVFLLGYAVLSAVGQVLIMLAVQYAPASQIAMPQYSQMLWALLFSYLVFHEPVDAVAFVGIAIICGAGLLTWAREKVKLPRLRPSSIIRPR